MKTLKVFSILFLFALLSSGAFALPPLDIQEYAYGTGGVILTDTTLYEIDLVVQNGFTTVYEENYTVTNGNPATTDGFGIFRLTLGGGSGTPQGGYSLSDYTNLAMSRTLYVIVKIKVNSGDPYRTVSRTILCALAYRSAAGLGNSVETGEILNGTILDEDIGANANIQVSKLAVTQNNLNCWQRIECWESVASG